MMVMITTEKQSPPDFPVTWVRGNQRVRFKSFPNKKGEIFAKEGEVVGYKYYWLCNYTNQNGLRWEATKFLIIRVLWEEDEFLQTVERMEKDVEYLYG